MQYSSHLLSSALYPTRRWSPSSRFLKAIVPIEMQHLLSIFLAVLSILPAQANSGDGPSLARRCTDRYGTIRHLVSSRSCCASPKFGCQSLGPDEGTYTSLSLCSLH